jgi:type IV secretory pathway VirB2 component (pilin)
MCGGVVYVWKSRKGRSEMPNMYMRLLRQLERVCLGRISSVIAVSAVLISGTTLIHGRPAAGMDYSSAAKSHASSCKQ